MNQRPPSKENGAGAEPRSKYKTQPRTASDPAVVALRMEDLTVWAVEHAARMPRDHKFTIGDKIVETCLEITTRSAQL